MRKSPFILTAVLIFAGFVPEALACNYAGKMRTYTRAVNRWLANPNANNSDRLCRAIARIDCKFKNKPGKPTPPTPAGLTCPDKNNGGGRGGGPRSFVGGSGSGAITSSGWVRNHHPFSCTFDWTITPDPANPAGFTLLDTSGSLLVPAGSTATADFDVVIDGSVPDGTIAFFDIVWIDTCTGLALADEFARFQITASDDCTVLPVAPIFFASDGSPSTVAWSVTNITGAPIVKTYSFFREGDPASVGEFNNGIPYDIFNLFPIDKMPGGGSVTVQPGETELIFKDDFIPGEFCDPEMISCCGLEIGGYVCCTLVANDDDGIPFQTLPLFHDLIGNPSGIGEIGIQIDRFNIQIPTNAAPTVPELLDLLGQQMLFAAENMNGFNFMPLLDEQGMLIMAPMQIPFQFFSNDPGLQWQPVPPPIFPLLENWPLQDNFLPMVEIVNGWLVPEIP